MFGSLFSSMTFAFATVVSPSPSAGSEWVTEVVESIATLDSQHLRDLVKRRPEYGPRVFELVLDQPIPDLLLVRILLEERVKIPATKIAMRGLVTLTAQTGNTDLLEDVFQRGLDLTVKLEGGDCDGATFILNSENEIARNWLLTHWMDGDIQSEILGRKIVASPVILETLFLRGLSYEALTHLFPNPLFFACRSETNRDQVIRLLLDKGADTLAVTDAGETLLHAVARSPLFGRDWLDLFLDQEIPIDQLSYDEKTAAMVALEMANLEFAHLLMKRGATLPKEVEQLAKVPSESFNRPSQFDAYVELFISTLDRYSMQELFHALVIEGNVVGLSALAQALRERGEEVDPNVRDHADQTPLHIAVQQGNKNTVSFLLQMGANPYLKNGKGISPEISKDLLLTTALEYPLVGLLEDFLDHCGAIDDLQEIVPDPLSALFWGRGQDNDQIQAAISLLLSKGANINFQHSENGMTPLLVAIRYGQFEGAKWLLAKGADAKLTTKDGEGVLHALGRNAEIDEEFLSLLLQKGFLLSSKDKKGYTPLWYALRDYNLKTAQLFIKKGAKPNQLDVTNAPLLHWLCQIPAHAIHPAEEDAYNALLDLAVKSLGGPQTEIGKHKRFALAIIASAGNISTMKAFLKLMKDSNQTIDINATNSNGATALYFAVMEKQSAMVRWLLEQGADPAIASLTGSTPLHSATRHGARGTARELIKAGGLDLLNIKDQFGKTPQDYDFCIKGTSTNFIKILSHAWELDGFVNLSGHDVNLEGSFGFAFFSYAQDALDRIAQSHPHLMTDSRKSLITNLFSNTLDFARWPFDQFGEGSAAALKVSTKETVLALTGWNGHGITVLFHRGYILICNRGSGATKPIEIYRIDERLMTPAIMAEFHWNTVDEYREKASQTLEKLQATRDDTSQAVESLCPLRDEQIVGNCAWEAIETALCAVLTLDELLNTGGDDAANLVAVERSFEAFQAFCQQLRLDLFEMLLKRVKCDPDFKNSDSIRQLAKRISALKLEELSDVESGAQDPKSVLRKLFKCRARANLSSDELDTCRAQGFGSPAPWRLEMEERFAQLRRNGKTTTEAQRTQRGLGRED